MNGSAPHVRSTSPAARNTAGLSRIPRLPAVSATRIPGRTRPRSGARASVVAAATSASAASDSVWRTWTTGGRTASIVRPRTASKGPSPPSPPRPSGPPVAPIAPIARSLLQVALALRRPAEHDPRLGHVMVDLILIARDQDRIEPVAPDLHDFERRQDRVGEVLLIEDVEILVDRHAPLGDVRLARPRTGDPQGDQPHIEMLGEVLADALAETLREAVDRPGVEGHGLLGLVPRDPAVLPATLEMDAPRPDVDAGLDAHRLRGPQQDMEADGVDLV